MYVTFLRCLLDNRLDHMFLRSGVIFYVIHERPRFKGAKETSETKGNSVREGQLTGQDGEIMDDMSRPRPKRR